MDDRFAAYVKHHAIDNPEPGQCVARVPWWGDPKQCRNGGKFDEGGLLWCGIHRPSRFGHAALATRKTEG